MTASAFIGTNPENWRPTSVLPVTREDSHHGLGAADQDSRPCSRSFRYRFRSLIPRILAAFPR